MADRFHFNPETGRTGKCSAEVQCRFGQSADQHGATREDARANYEAQMAPELFSNTQSKPSTRPLTSDEFYDTKRQFREMAFTEGPNSQAYHRWGSDAAKSAALRTELELRGIDSSHIASDQLTTRNYLFLNEDGNRVAGAFDSREDAARAGFYGAPLGTQKLSDEALERVKLSHPAEPEELQRMAEILEKERTRSHYPVPVKKSNRYTEEQLDREAAEFEGVHGYSPAEMISTRHIGNADLDEAELEYGGYVTVKIPSGSEAEMSTELIRRELRKPPAPRGRYGW